MTVVAELVTHVKGKDTGLGALLLQMEKRLQRLAAASDSSAAAIEQSLVKAQDRAAHAAQRAAQAHDQAGKASRAGSETAAAAAAKLARDAERAEAATLRHAIAAARLAQAQGNASEGTRILAQAIAASSQTSTAALNAMRQLADMENRLSNAKGPVTLPRTIDGLSGSALKAGQALASLAGAAGLSFGVSQLTAMGQEALTASLHLQKAQNTLRVLAGSTAAYESAMATARRQQQLFGGSLADTVDGLTGLVTVSRASGAALETLIDLSQRLAVKDPSQGIQGARIALNEALSGDPTALARRYEIPKAALAALRDTSTSTSEKLAVIDQYLNDIGITSEAVSGTIPRSTLAFNALGASLEGLQVGLGAGLADALTPAAQGLTALTNALQGQNVQETLIGLASTFRILSGDVQGLTAAERHMAAQMLAGIGIKNQAQMAADALAASEAAAAATVAANTATRVALIESFAAGRITSEQYATAIAQLAQAESQAASTAPALTAAIDTQTQATQAATDQLIAQIQAKQQSALAAQALARVEDALTQAALNVVTGVQTQEQAVAMLSARYPQLAGEASALIAAQLQLAAASREAAAALNASRIAAQAKNVVDLTGGRGSLAGDPGRGPGGDGGVAAVYQRQVDAQKAAEQQTTKIIAASGGGRAAARATAMRVEQQATQTGYQKMEDAAQQHQERLLAIERDFYAKSEQQRQANEVGKRKSRYAFYAQLSQAGGDLSGSSRAAFDQAAQQIGAAYEAAYAESQRMAQAGQQKLAAEYLALRQSQLEEDLAVAAAQAKAQAEGNQAEVQRLAALEALRKDAQRAELEQLQQAGDANQAARDQAVADEAANYDATIARAETAAERKIAAANRSAAAIQAENDALREQAGLYQQIGGGAPRGASAPGTPTPGAAPRAPTATPGAAALPEDADPWGALEAAIRRLQDATSSGLREVTGAIRGLQGRLVT
jgi:hypothetical protein